MWYMVLKIKFTTKKKEEKKRKNLMNFFKEKMDEEPKLGGRLGRYKGQK